MPQRCLERRVRLCCDLCRCLGQQSAGRKAPPQAEPDQDRRKNDQIAAADDEALPFEAGGAWLRDQESRCEIQRDDRGRGQRSCSPPPADRCRKQEKDEKQEEAAGVALGPQHHDHEKDDIGEMCDRGDAHVDPPVVPDRPCDDCGEGKVGGQHQLDRDGWRNARVADRGDQEQCRQRQPGDRDYPSGRLTEDPVEHGPARLRREPNHSNARSANANRKHRTTDLLCPRLRG